MPLEYIECFGQPVGSAGLAASVRSKECPFTHAKCRKKFGNTLINGACTLAPQSTGLPVICCPWRLYANNYQTLRDVAEIAFGKEARLLLEHEAVPDKGRIVVPFGHRQGKEIRIAHREGGHSSKFSVDWVLALLDENHNLEEFVATEVQTIDTTGNYQRQFWDIAQNLDPSAFSGKEQPVRASSNFNYENVNKRILPQLITKGHILRREPLCKKGLFFICPQPVYERITDRVGTLPAYPVQTGSITFLAYQVDTDSPLRPYPLELITQHTSTTEQLSVAFSSPRSLPRAGVYETAIRRALDERL